MNYNDIITTQRQYNRRTEYVDTIFTLDEVLNNKGIDYNVPFNGANKRLHIWKNAHLSNTLNFGQDHPRWIPRPRPSIRLGGDADLDLETNGTLTNWKWDNHLGQQDLNGETNLLLQSGEPLYRYVIYYYIESNYYDMSCIAHSEAEAIDKIEELHITTDILIVSITELEFNREVFYHEDH